MKRIIVLAMLLVSQVLIAGNVICDDSKADYFSIIGNAQRYSPHGKIDPFQSIFVHEPTKLAPRAQQTACISNPVLEQVDISQLKLTGIIMTEHEPIALVQEADGKGHIVKEKACIGRHGGMVEVILEDRIIILEEMQDATGQLDVKKIELKLNGR